MCNDVYSISRFEDPNMHYCVIRLQELTLSMAIT